MQNPIDQQAVVVVGSINMDFVVRANRLPRPGESVVGHEFFQGFGGKGANQAIGVARLGVSPVRFIGAVGGDEIGSHGLESLRAEKIDCDQVRIVNQTNTGVALITLDRNGENCIAAAPGANAYVDEEFVVGLADEVFQSAKLLVVCQEIPIEAIAIVLQKAKSFGVATLFNPAPPNPQLVAADILKHVDYLTPNETEVLAITGIDLTSTSSDNNLLNKKVQAIEKLIELGANNIAITTGADGCFVFDKSEMDSASQSVHIPAPHVMAIDTTAAGDCFNAALATAIYLGQKFQDACKWANQVAAISVTRKGAQASLPRLSDLNSSTSPFAN